MVKARITATRTDSSYDSGTPEVEFDCAPALKKLGADALRRVIEENVFGPGDATDRLAQEAARYDEQLERFFDMLASGIGTGISGYDVWVLDKKGYVQWLQENRPEVLEKIDEQWYKHHLV
jgi:hypothetical protein